MAALEKESEDVREKMEQLFIGAMTNIDEVLGAISPGLLTESESPVPPISSVASNSDADQQKEKDQAQSSSDDESKEEDAETQQEESSDKEEDDDDASTGTSSSFEEVDPSTVKIHLPAKTRPLSPW
jgi:hypothetical protein